MKSKRIKKLSKEEIEENYVEYYYEEELYVNYLDDYYGTVHIWEFIDLENLPEGVNFE